MPYVRAYAWRRVLRLVPAYWLVLTVVAVFIRPEVFTEGKAVLFYGFAQVYDSSIGLAGLGAAWSLCVEAVVLRALPLYALAMRRWPPGTSGRASGWSSPGSWSCSSRGSARGLWALEGGLQFLGSPLITLPAFLDWFALGMGLALVSVWSEGRDAVPTALAWSSASGGRVGVRGVAFAALGCGRRHLTDRGLAENLSVHVLHGAFALGLLAPAVLGDPERGVVRRLMGFRCWPGWGWCRTGSSSGRGRCCASSTT